ncbi:MAG: YqfO family protein [Lentisphaeria bacterium]|nr:YqfO family protein [Lentisphaeria bacterium]
MKCFYLAVYVPESHRDSLKQALFQAGAGKIGNYDSCCWETEGTGQFRPLPGSHPFLGSQDRVEHAAEWKIELIVPAECIGEVIASMKRAHPYETPAFHYFPVETE